MERFSNCTYDINREITREEKNIVEAFNELIKTHSLSKNEVSYLQLYYFRVLDSLPIKEAGPKSFEKHINTVTVKQLASV